MEITRKREKITVDDVSVSSATLQVGSAQNLTVYYIYIYMYIGLGKIMAGGQAREEIIIITDSPVGWT